MSRIFISYRRDDAAGHAGRLFDRLQARLRAELVFLDTEKIRAGHDFLARIDREIARAEKVLVVVGRDWATTADSEGRPRLFDPEDVVRHEIEAALRSKREDIVPVLVGGAGVPSARQVPESLQALRALSFAAVRHEHFDDDFRALLRLLEVPADDDEVPIHPLLPYLVDRAEQGVEIAELLAGHKLGEERRPLFAIVHGHAREHLDRYLECACEFVIPEALGRARRDSSGVRELAITWSAKTDPDEWLRSMTGLVAGRVGGTAGDTPERIQACVARLRTTVVFHSTLESRGWDAALDPERIRRWRAWWASFPDGLRGKPTVVLVAIRYMPPPRRWWPWPRHAPIARLRDFVTDRLLHHEHHARMPGRTLTELAPVRQPHVEEWLRELPRHLRGRLAARRVDEIERRVRRGVDALFRDRAEVPMGELGPWLHDHLHAEPR